MKPWPIVPWTEAAQLLGKFEGGTPPATPGMSPKLYFDDLIARGKLDVAIAFLGAALPRFEAVKWAFKVVGSVRGSGESNYRDTLFAGVGKWLIDTGDSSRRSIWNAALQSDESCPERLLAGAVYFSGGSIGPEDVSPIQPPPEICGKLASCAILLAAYATKGPEPVLLLAVRTGDEIANETA